MRYRMFLLIGLLAAGITVISLTASAYTVTNTYNLERTTIYGYVDYVENQVAYIQIDNGDQIAVQLGPESYWNAHRFYLTRGEYVEMLVWYDPADRYTAAYFVSEIWGPGYHYRITNDEGVPYWVIFADDYYYSLGYRASCVSFMLWYDCPPVYFIYLVLPPPPPLRYFCYYGPHWRTHHHDWHHGPRFRRGGSYWHDGRGYERHGRRTTNYTRNNSNRSDSNNGGNRSARYSDTYKRPEAPATRNIVRPHTAPLPKSPQKPQQVGSRRTAYPQLKPSTPIETRATASSRKVFVPRSAPKKRQIQTQSKIQTTKGVGNSRDVRQIPRDNIKLKNNKASRASKAEKRVRVGNQSQDRKHTKR